MIYYIIVYRSEGIARTGYLIPGCDGIPGLDLAGNSSAAAIAAAVALPALGGLRPPKPPIPSRRSRASIISTQARLKYDNVDSEKIKGDILII